MADVDRDKAAKLCLALEHEDSRLGATNAIREFIEGILLEPDGEQLKNHPEGRPGGNARRSQRQQEVAGHWRPLAQIPMVAGARNPLTLAFAWTAA